MDVKWNGNGNWLATASRDHLIKLFDIRTMKELWVLKGHKKDVNSMPIILMLINSKVRWGNPSEGNSGNSNTSLAQRWTCKLLIATMTNSRC